MSSSSGYSFGGRLFVAILLALMVGYGWACWETGRNPLDILKFFGSKEEKNPNPTPPAPAKKETPRTEPTPVKKEPPKTDPAAVAPPVAPAATPKRAYSPSEMSGLYGSLDDLIRRGRFFEAGERLNKTDQQMIPADDASRFSDYKSRLDKYNALMSETTRGLMIEMPKMAEILVQGGGKLIVKVLAEDTRSVAYETITGIRSSIERARIEQMNPLEPLYAEVEIKMEHKKQAESRGLEVTDLGAGRLSYKEKGTVRVTGQLFFDLADFCARNGANKLLATLFDEALKRDHDLLTTVHENKADRMVNVFLYFLTINSAADANNALSLLEKKYGDTRAYREKVASDKEVQEAVALVLRKPPAGAVAAAPRPATPPAATDPPSSDPVAKSQPSPAKPPQTVEIERQPETLRPAEPTGTALEGAPAKVADLVAKGDRYFDEAMKHLRNSDPDINPTGWADENKKALEFFTKANQECYFPAQENYGKGAVPQPLLDRVRETGMRSSLCRKRSVSTRK